MGSLESVFCADNFAFEICSQCRVIIGEACNNLGLLLPAEFTTKKRTLYPQITTKERFIHVNILDLNLDLVCLAIRLLSATKLAARAEKGRCRIGKGLL